jgi:hypothetical protein
MNTLAEPGAALRAALGNDVRFEWTGRPVQGFYLRTVDALLIPFTGLWLAFAIFWETLASAAGGPVFMRLWGIPFVLMGLYIFAGRFVVDAYLRGRTAYGVANGQAYIVRGGILPRVATFALASTAPIELSLRGDGSGTIGFGARPSYRNGFEIFNVGSMREFVGIRDAAAVYRIVTELAAQRDGTALSR